MRAEARKLIARCAAEQGVQPRVTDPAVLREVAALIADVPEMPERGEDAA